MDEIKELRKLLWLYHGHQSIYRDDGEMQCGVCMLDFKRHSIELIVKRFDDMAWERMIEYIKVKV